MAARYLTLTWAEFHRDARRLADLAAKHGPYQGIVAVSRGGLIPAAILAHALSVRLIECVSVATYDQANRGRFGIRVKSGHKGCSKGSGWGSSGPGRSSISSVYLPKRRMCFRM